MKPCEMYFLSCSSRSSEESPESSELEGVFTGFGTFRHFGTGEGVCSTRLTFPPQILFFGVAADVLGVCSEFFFSKTYF